MSTRLRGLYAVADTGLLTDQQLVPAVAAVLAGGARIIQYRDKSGAPAKRREQATALQTLCRSYDVPLIVNDDLALALEINADGVHLGTEDGDLASARAALDRPRILGASCYNRLDLAEQAVAAGADYIAFGSFFPSPTKPDAVRAEPMLLTRARDLDIPLCAIGGITADNAGELISAGASMVAVINDLFAAPDPEAAARRIADLFRS